MVVHLGFLASPEGGACLTVAVFGVMLFLSRTAFSADPTKGASLPSWLLPAMFVIFGIIAVVAFRRMLPPQEAAPAVEREAEAISLSGDWMLSPIGGGEPVPLSSFRGKSVFLNVWATWCPPCVAEMPSIQKLARKLADDKDVAFVMVSIDNGPDEVKDFLKEHGYTLPVYMPRANPPKELRSQGVPLTALLDRDGKLRMRHLGSQDWNTEEVASLLRKYARESAAARAEPVDAPREKAAP